MNIHIIAPTLPPQLDGIGDYTAHLAGVLAKSQSVTLLTGMGTRPNPIPGVTLAPVFSPQQPSSVRAIGQKIETDQPDWILLQYNQFSYGRWGLNPYLPLMLHGLKRRLPQTRLAVMFHEDFVPCTNWKFAVMRIWQRRQFLGLGRAADRIFFSIDPWVEQYRSWFPGKPVIHLPVGSNIPCIPMAKQAARDRLNIGNEVMVLGVFGTAHASRLLGKIREAAETAIHKGHKILILYIGPHSREIQQALPDIPMLAEGPFSGEEVSHRFAAMDIYLAPFIDGVSTRRTSFLTALQHGVATVATRGPLTDRMLLDQDGQAFLLSGVDAPGEFGKQALRLIEEKPLRTRLACEAQQWHEREFAWEVIEERFLNALN